MGTDKRGKRLGSKGGPAMTYAGSSAKGAKQERQKQAAADSGVALKMDHTEFERF